MGDNLDFFVWTEIFNCGKIGNISLKSFIKFHPKTRINVFGTENDFKQIERHPNINLISFKDNILLDLMDFFGFPNLTQRKILSGFSKGHLGTARLWAYLIKSRMEKYMIHFDSDVIFRENYLDFIMSKSKDYDLIGPYRLYSNNPHNREDVRRFRDVCQTSLFSFNKEKISNFRYKTLIKMCLGSYNPLKHPVIDFFDPVMFNILKNNGKIFHLDYNDVGGVDLSGSRDNIFHKINNYETPFKIDFGNKLIHFSAVGSGMNIFFNKNTSIPQEYKAYALDRYALFVKIYYDEDIGIDLSSYQYIIDQLSIK